MIKIKEPVMIGGQSYARGVKVEVDVDDAAVVVGMGRAEYVKAEAKGSAKSAAKGATTDGASGQQQDGQTGSNDGSANGNGGNENDNTGAGGQ
ncbi:hypothetical protein [Noviherbaspirillum denitrificans]|uniref:Uncharacterized protein n=1 Tax=Noviherbaspirillum denitrificans TaxID=1968433 RepID=A0A254T6Z6_9BURK|nr:hypothetical protein [Noviherbaspirillum denitrificans]OWW18414.1 hypothetical protein AYR66_01020 [Noviherbaspirillum denitrificans]OWW19378.1 hypothetical protein AYR66_07505 [Noviherbaspirillum denitrificans]